MLQTERFSLREVHESGRPTFIACQAEPRFARFLTMAERAEAHANHTFGLFLGWAAEVPRRDVQLVIVRKAEPDGYLGSIGTRTGGLPPGQGEMGLNFCRSSGTKAPRPRS